MFLIFKFIFQRPEFMNVHECCIHFIEIEYRTNFSQISQSIRKYFSTRINLINVKYQCESD